MSGHARSPQTIAAAASQPGTARAARTAEASCCNNNNYVSAMINYCCLVTAVVRLPGEFLRNEPHFNKLLATPSATSWAGGTGSCSMHAAFLKVLTIRVGNSIVIRMGSTPPPPPHTERHEPPASRRRPSWAQLGLRSKQWRLSVEDGAASAAGRRRAAARVGAFSFLLLLPELLLLGWNLQRAGISHSRGISRCRGR